MRVQTELGDIVIEVDTARAPVTAANFLKYVDAGHYDGGTFHRTVKMDNQPESTIKIEVIQAGVNPDRAKDGFPPIALERTNVTGILHKDGVVSMARGAPDSATSGWFICINDQPSLDFGGMRNPDGQGFARVRPRRVGHGRRAKDPDGAFVRPTGRRTPRRSDSRRRSRSVKVARDRAVDARMIAIGGGALLRWSLAGLALLARLPVPSLRARARRASSAARRRPSWRRSRSARPFAAARASADRARQAGRSRSRRPDRCPRLRSRAAPGGLDSTVAARDCSPKPRSATRSWRRRTPKPVDLDRDGDLDMLVASLGVLFPSNAKIGAVVVLENDGRGRFTNRVLASEIARVSDVRAGDLDGDGDLDLAVAQFGYNDGETRWMRERRRLAVHEHDPAEPVRADQRRDRRSRRRRRSRHHVARQPGVGRGLRLRQRRRGRFQRRG